MIAATKVGSAIKAIKLRSAGMSICWQDLEQYRRLKQEYGVLLGEHEEQAIEDYQHKYSNYLSEAASDAEQFMLSSTDEYVERWSKVNKLVREALQIVEAIEAE